MKTVRIMMKPDELTHGMRRVVIFCLEKYQKMPEAVSFDGQSYHARYGQRVLQLAIKDGEVSEIGE